MSLNSVVYYKETKQQLMVLKRLSPTLFRQPREGGGGE